MVNLDSPITKAEFPEANIEQRRDLESFITSKSTMEVIAAAINRCEQNRTKELSSKQKKFAKAKEKIIEDLKKATAMTGVTQVKEPNRFELVMTAAQEIRTLIK